jgi:phenylpyruvate tautomerase PptA (4-oxalocrotonate tautomerase family)
MAMALVEVLAGQPVAVKHDYLEGVRRALCSSLCIPDDDPTIRLIEHDRSDIAVPDRFSPRYTIVTITMFKGRTLETKRRLYQSLVTELGKLGVPADDVQVILHEPPAANWSLGGIPASDVDPGFKINI